MRLFGGEREIRNEKVLFLLTLERNYILGQRFALLFLERFNRVNEIPKKFLKALAILIKVCYNNFDCNPYFFRGKGFFDLS